MPNMRFILVLLTLFALIGLAVLQLTPVDAQEPSGLTLTPTERTGVPPTTEVPPPPTTVVPPTTEVPPPPTTAVPPTTEVPPPPTTVVPPTTEVPSPTTPGVTIPPPLDTATPIPGQPERKASKTTPVLPATGQSPPGNGIPLEGLFAVLLLTLVGWYFWRGVAGARTQK